MSVAPNPISPTRPTEPNARPPRSSTGFVAGRAVLNEAELAGLDRAVPPRLDPPTRTFEISRPDAKTERHANANPRRAAGSGADLARWLTNREREVAGWAALGATNLQIADQLVVSIRTVEGHLLRTFVKLGVRTRAELANALGIRTVEMNLHPSRCHNCGVVLAIKAGEAPPGIDSMSA